MKVYIVAGEPSGDLLASGLMEALRRIDPDVEFRGVGGEGMTALGLRSVFDISEISVMGIFEVLPRLRRILGHIRQVADDVQAWRPDVLVTVDSWGFVSSLLGKLRKRGTKIPIVHYVAPQVWAWKKGRAKNVARLVDRLMLLLPNEGSFFEKYGLQCDFVGHPVTERMASAKLDTADFRRRNGIPADAEVLCVLPGSRRSETDRLIPIFRDAIARIRERHGDFTVVVPTVAGVERRVRAGFEGFGLPVHVVTGNQERYNAFAASRAAIAKSGTVSLELAALGVPHVIAYRFSAMTNAVAKAFVRTPYANLINILAQRSIIPEFVLGNCRADLIADGMLRLLEVPQAAAVQVEQAHQIMKQLRPSKMLPSDRAAQIVAQTARREVLRNPGI